MQTQKPYNFTLIGRSGSGKGTQAKLLMEKFGNIYYISTGDLFRSLAKTESDVGDKVRKILKEGGLPYDDLATTLWMHEIAFNVRSDQGIMADGFPRCLNEAKNLDGFLKFLERGDRTFYILVDISRQEAHNRLTKRRICKDCGNLIPWVGEFKEMKVCPDCGGELMPRADDTAEAIKNRLDYYDERVTQVVNYYRERGKLIEVNGEQPIEKVFHDILRAIEK